MIWIKLMGLGEASSLYLSIFEHSSPFLFIALTNFILIMLLAFLDAKSDHLDMVERLS
jgi:hypothetical protein